MTERYQIYQTPRRTQDPKQESFLNKFPIRDLRSFVTVNKKKCANLTLCWTHFAVTRAVSLGRRLSCAMCSVMLAVTSSDSKRQPVPLCLSLIPALSSYNWHTAKHLPLPSAIEHCGRALVINHVRRLKDVARYKKRPLSILWRLKSKMQYNKNITR